jgi:Protein of unknown function (DUF3617)
VSAACSRRSVRRVESHCPGQISRRVGGDAKTSFGNGNVPARVIRQCVDASTDQMMQARSVGSSQRDCTKRDVQRSGDTITIDSACTVAGKARTSHIVITGSFDSAYTMILTSQGEGAPAGSRSMTMAVKWISACAADQKPGDMIMADGRKMNILNAQRPGMPGLPQPPR